MFWPGGTMASSSVSGAGGCGFESHPGRNFVSSTSEVARAGDALIIEVYESFLLGQTLLLSRTYSCLVSDLKCEN